MTLRPFAERYQTALQNADLKEGLTAFQRSWRHSRDTQMAELEDLTDTSFDEMAAELARTKRAVTANVEAHFEAFKANAEAAGSVVIVSATAEDACAEVARICRDNDADMLVKGKSMVSEEIELNRYLENIGITPLETDLGEWLLQLDNDRPSHLVMPIIHRRRGDIAQILEKVLGRVFDPDDIPTMVRAARGELRQRFLAAKVGLSGANALVSEAGSIMLVCNEGNNRLAVSLPDVHIVVAGVDKLVPSHRDAITQARLLARSATGQSLTSYTTWMAGPRLGQKQFIIFVDNGRSSMSVDPDFSSAMSCIRCGACANVCPPYQVVGGHAFGHIYTGAIGLVNTSFHHGLEAAAGPQSLCISCGACTSVCPVQIPLHSQILKVRSNVVEGPDGGRKVRSMLTLFRNRRLVGLGVRALALLSRPWVRGGRLAIRYPQRHVSWRQPPAIPVRPARSSLRRSRHRRDPSEPSVALFMQCLSDRLAPEIVLSTERILRALGANVAIPLSQHCCGLPAYDSGDWRNARRMAMSTIESLAGYDLVVTPGTSCFVAIHHDYPALFRDDAEWLHRAEELAGRTFDLTGFLASEGRVQAGAFDNGDYSPVAVDRFCHSSNVLERGAAVEDLLWRLCRVPAVVMDEAEVCCGFGGSTSFSSPEVGSSILRRKLDCAAEADASVVITDNPGCALHMSSGVHASGRDLRVMHLAEFLAERLPAENGRGDKSLGS